MENQTAHDGNSANESKYSPAENRWVNIIGSLILFVTVLIGGSLCLVYTFEILSTFKKFDRIKNKIGRNVSTFLSIDKIKWNMATALEDKVANPSFNLADANGPGGKARYFNGENSYIKTPLIFKDWKKLTISFWVKPEMKADGKMAAILDNGHTGNTDFTIQTADASGTNWTLHCAGTDIIFNIPLDKWQFVLINIDGGNGIITAYVDDINVGKVVLGRSFEFGASPLTIGRLANIEDRYFKGAISNLAVTRPDN